MQQVRIRSAKSTDDQRKRHVFVEVSPDRWLEINQPVSRLSTAKIKRFLLAVQEWEKPDSNGRKRGFVSYATRAFSVGIIQNWREEKPVTIE